MKTNIYNKNTKLNFNTLTIKYERRLLVEKKGNSGWFSDGGFEECLMAHMAKLMPARYFNNFFNEL